MLEIGFDLTGRVLYRGQIESATSGAVVYGGSGL